MNELQHLSILLADDESSKVSRLQEILEGSGISVSVTEDHGSWLLNFDWDSDKVHRIRTRGAGRKPLLLSGSPSVKEVLELQQENGVEKTCQILNISPSTFYRRKKVVREKYAPEEFDSIPF